MTGAERRIRQLEEAASGRIPVAFVGACGDLWEAQIRVLRRHGASILRSTHKTLEEAVEHIQTVAKRKKSGSCFPIIIDDIPEVGNGNWKI